MLLGINVGDMILLTFGIYNMDRTVFVVGNVELRILDR